MKRSTCSFGLVGVLGVEATRSPGLDKKLRTPCFSARLGADGGGTKAHGSFWCSKTMAIEVPCFGLNGWVWHGHRTKLELKHLVKKSSALRLFILEANEGHFEA